MRILLVANGNIKHRGARYYDQGLKLANGLIRNGHHVYFLSDRDLLYSLAQFSTPGIYGTKTHKIKHISRFFLEVCSNIKPQLIILVHADLISPEALFAARKMFPAVKIAQFNVDIICNPHNIRQINSKLAAVDATFITTAGAGLEKFAQQGSMIAYAPNIVDSSIEWPRCFERSDQPHDVFWALRALKGSIPGDRRIEYPLYLADNGIKIDYHGMNGKPLLYNAGYFEAINQAKIGINISQIWSRGNYNKAADDDLYLYSSDRIAHYLGSGLLVFTTRDNRLEELFVEDKEMIFFDSKEELLEKIRYYLAHDEERKKIAKSGWEKAHNHYNERLVAKYMLEATFATEFSENYLWPLTKY